MPCFAKSVERNKDGDKFCPYCGAENEINKEEPSHDIPPDFSVKGAGKKKKERLSRSLF